MSEEQNQNYDRMRRLEDRVGSIEMDLSNQLTRLNGQIENLLELAKKYVIEERFKPVQVIVYGIVGMIMTSVLAAIVARVLIK